MMWRTIEAPKRKADYRDKYLRILAVPPPASYDYMNKAPNSDLPIMIGDIAQIYMRRAFRDMPIYVPDQYADLYTERVLELLWKCPHCDHSHTIFIPECWISEGKAEFVEKSGDMKLE